MSIDQHDDLEAQLRAMLRERAGDVTTVPERVYAFEQADGLVAPPRRGWRPGTRLVAVAAAVIAVLVVAAAVFAMAGDGGKRGAPVGTSAPRPTTPTGVPRPSAELAWFGLASLPEFWSDTRTSQPGKQTLGLTWKAQGKRTVVDGDVMSTNTVTVYEPGQFDSRQVTSWQRLTLSNGTSARFGNLADERGVREPTVAFRSSARRWVTVQGHTQVASDEGVLALIAKAVRADSRVAPRVPFRLASLPAGFTASAMTWGEDGAGVTIDLQGPDDGEDLRISVLPRSTADRTDAVTRTVDGRTTWVNRTFGTAETRLGTDVVVRIDLGPEDGSQSSPRSWTLLNAVLAGITWYPGDGVSAEEAIP